MSKIVAGHFPLQEDVARAREALLRAGFPERQISDFYVSQPGQHAVTPIGGDRMVSPGAKETPSGVVEGAATAGAVGAAIGAATIPVTGPLGPVVGGLVGAHVGSLYSFAKMKESGEPEQGDREHANEEAPRKSGMMVAVAVDSEAGADRALDTLREAGAEDLEQAEGTIADGDWTDFNPLSIPQRVH